MYLIASAFMRGAQAHDNSCATAHLIRAYYEYLPELCVGVYQGQREVSVKLIGFRDQQEAVRIAHSIIASFGQECVLLVTHSGAAYAVTDKAMAYLGNTARSVTDPAKGGAESYTQFMDGTYMVANHALSVLAA